MAKREIVWSNLAKLELQNTIEFYFERNGNANYSLQLLDEIEDLTNTLSKNHFIGRLCKNKFTRVIPMKTYLIFYEVNLKRIEIVSFWNSLQNPENRKVK
jgi:plasmid stabilization system protein ParE